MVKSVLSKFFGHIMNTKILVFVVVVIALIHQITASARPVEGANLNEHNAPEHNAPEHNAPERNSSKNGDGTHTETVDGMSIKVPNDSHIERGNSGLEIVKNHESGNTKESGPKRESQTSNKTTSEKHDISIREKHEHGEHPIGNEYHDSRNKKINHKKEKNETFYRHAPGVVIGSGIKETVANIVDKYNNATGKLVYITSGVRNAHRQAAAMFTKFQMGSSGNVYSNKTALKQIHDAYISNISHGKNATVKAMERVIQKQVTSGVMISRHLSSKAIDCRSKGLSKHEISTLERIIKESGGVVIREGRPPHLHIQFP